MIGFSEVILTEQTVADYADTLAYLGAAIRLYRDTFRRWAWSAAKAEGRAISCGVCGQDFQPPERQPPAASWIVIRDAAGAYGPAW